MSVKSIGGKNSLAMVPCDAAEEGKLEWAMKFTVLSNHHKPANPLSRDKAPGQLVA